MNSGDPIDFERQLRGMELRRPPAEWKALLLPKPVPPLLPKPLLFGLAACWVLTGGLIVSTPEDPLKDQPLLLPPSGNPFVGSDEGFLLGFNATQPQNR